MIKDFLIPGLIIGLTAGLSPGPLMALVISETMLHNAKSGIKVALAPIATDLPIILITFFIFNWIKDFNFVLGLISICGGIFLIYLGYENFIAGPDMSGVSASENSFRKAVITNVLSPHPYIFWLTVGGSFISKGGYYEGIAFCSAFYLMLVGSKIAIALTAGRGKRILKSGYYVYIARAMGALMFLFAALLLKNGIGYFNS